MNGKSFEVLRVKHEIGRSKFARWVKLHVNALYKWVKFVTILAFSIYMAYF